MTWDMNIERVHNGFIVRSLDIDDEDAPEYVRLISWTDRTGSQLDAYVELLWEVADHFGMMGSKYDKQRLAIGIAPGSAYEEPFDVTRAESEPGHPESENRTDLYGNKGQDTPEEDEE